MPANINKVNQIAPDNEKPRSEIKTKKKTKSELKDKKRVTKETKQPPTSGYGKLLYEVQHWDPFPFRAHDVTDVNEVNKRILLVIICFVLWTSFLLICISTYVLDARRSREYAPADSFSFHVLSFSAVLLFTSLVSFTLALCGFVGVLRENIILIRIFYVTLIVLLSFKLCAAFFMFFFTGTAKSIVGSAIGDQMIVNYRVSTDIEATMDYLQTSFRCCGLREQGFKDWSRSIYFNCSENSPSTERCGVPWSCCRNGTGLENALCGRNVQKLDRNIASRTIYTKGCLLALQQLAKDHAILVVILLLLETLFLTVLIFQCTHLVNELQMMTGVYRGPWWSWIGQPRPESESPATRRDGHWDGPTAAAPFHLVLVWHEAAPGDQQRPALDQRRPPGDQQRPAFDQRRSTVDQQRPALDQRRPPGDQRPRHDQRRSTVGQRFFRAVLSRASRVANRRQAMTDEEAQHSASRAGGEQDQTGSPGAGVERMRLPTIASDVPQSDSREARSPDRTAGQKRKQSRMTSILRVGKRNGSRVPIENSPSADGASPKAAAKQGRELFDSESTGMTRETSQGESKLTFPDIHSDHAGNEILIGSVPVINDNAQNASDTESTKGHPSVHDRISKPHKISPRAPEATHDDLLSAENSHLSAAVTNVIVVDTDVAEHIEPPADLLSSILFPATVPSRASPTEPTREPPSGTAHDPPAKATLGSSDETTRDPPAAEPEPSAPSEAERRLSVDATPAAPQGRDPPAAGPEPSAPSEAERRLSVDATPAAPQGDSVSPSETTQRPGSDGGPGGGSEGPARGPAEGTGELGEGLGGLAANQQQSQEAQSTDKTSGKKSKKSHRRSKPHKKKRKAPTEPVEGMLAADASAAIPRITDSVDKASESEALQPSYNKLDVGSVVRAISRELRAILPSRRNASGASEPTPSAPSPADGQSSADAPAAALLDSNDGPTESARRPSTARGFEAGYSERASDPEPGDEYLDQDW